MLDLEDLLPPSELHSYSLGLELCSAMSEVQRLRERGKRKEGENVKDHADDLKRMRMRIFSFSRWSSQVKMCEKLSNGDFLLD